MPWWCWLSAAAALWIATFGFWLTILASIFATVFLCGLFCELLRKTGQLQVLFEENIFSDIAVKAGIRRLVEDMTRIDTRKSDQRLTGSHAIDDSLQEIIFYLMRDFVNPWYNKVSSSDEFPLAIRESLEKIVIEISARMKQVEWITFLTTRLVDDAASHLRIYRLTCVKMTADASKKSTPQSLASFKSATEGCHSRNNSDGAGNIKTHSRHSSISDRPVDFETMFFRIEAENVRSSHEQLCVNRETERTYLTSIVDAFLYLVLPERDFNCVPMRNFLKETIVGGLVVPFIDLLSEPDWINRCIIWLNSDVGVTSEAFLATLRVTTDRHEVLALSDFVNKEIMFLRGRDSGSEVESYRQQLNSLMYVRKILDYKLEGGMQKDAVIAEKLVYLSLPVILNNSLGLSYFIDFLSTVDMQNYLFLHIGIESWKTSLVSELKRSESAKLPRSQATSFRDAAIGIYQQFIAENSASRVNLDVVVERRLYSKITVENLNETWFDELSTCLHKKLTEKALPDFYRSNIYLKLLSDLELLKDDDDVEDEDDDDNKSAIDEARKPRAAPPETGVGRFQLKVDIIDSGVVQDKGKTYGIYALNVVKTYENGYSKQWHVYRRYSDFYDLQQKVKDYYSDLGKLPFPGKKTFNNMGAITLAKRMKMLNDYLQILLHSGVAETHHKLPGLLLGFLEPGEYDKSLTLGSAFESVVSPIKSSMRSVSAVVKMVPDNFWNSVDQGQRKKDENVPVRILLLLMDQVFDLQSRNQWLRRRIVVLLRQIFGHLFTKKMLDYVEQLTEPQRVAGYINALKDILWPNGVRASNPADRDEQCRLRSRLLAKATLFSAADDFKHLLGSETTRKGLLRVFSTFQHTSMNRRLVHVLFEALLHLIFPSLTDFREKLLISINANKKSPIVRGS